MNMYDKYFDYLDSLNNLFDGDRYVSYDDLLFSIEPYKKLKCNIFIISFVSIKLILHGRFREAAKIGKIVRQINLLIRNREIYNDSFIKREQAKHYEIDGQVLDNQQIEAVVACEDASLVLAPAGSGKTLSLLAKLEYIHNNLNIPTHEILTVSFTRKTVSELKERLNIAGINISTFHSLGKSILQNSYSNDNKVLLETPVKTRKYIKDTLESLIKDDNKFAELYNNFILFYFTTPIDPGTIKNDQERIEFNKSFLRKTFQSISLDKKYYDKSKPTLAGEFIKSKEEQIIADWLYINSVPYDYEKQYEYINRKYLPDFTITQFGEPVYLEHFGVSRKNGQFQPNQSFDNPDQYIQNIYWKRELHQENNTVLIESYSDQWRNGTLLSHIENELKRVGIKITRKNEQEINALLHKSGQYKVDIEAFHELIYTFLTLQKNNILSLNDIRAKVAELDDDYIQHRANLFLQIYEPIFNRYQSHLNEKNHIDFADMINQAICEVKRLPNRSFPYSYILIDEVQDLSYNRYQLIKSLLDKTPHSKLFAVGNDWQSIFRFTGSDLSLIRDFTTTFGRNTYKSLIESTHRFGSPTTHISSAFIQKNPHQETLSVKGRDGSNTPIRIRLNTLQKDQNRQNTIGEDARTLNSILKELECQYGAEQLSKKQIQLISRYNWDIDRISGLNAFRINKTENEIKIDWRATSHDHPIELTFCTMHKAKGITRDIVIILNMNSGNKGMPSVHSDDPLISMLLAHAEDYPYAEERRLFYVSITRARDITYVIANRKNPSQFLFEISEDLTKEYEHVCPKCKIGELQIKKGTYGDFWGCSNFVYGCDYRNKIKVES